MNRNWQERTELLLGDEKLSILNSSKVLVVGVGGVGAYAAEMLCRSGIGSMTIVDADVVSLTNINRQLVALHSTVGQDKVEILGERLLDINPELNLTKIKCFIKDDAVCRLLESDSFDFVVDAIDTLAPKVYLIKESLKREIPLVSSMGAGAKTDPTLVEIKDISKTNYCPLAHMLRKRLHKEGIRSGFMAVFSTEEIRQGAMVLCEEQNKKSNVGTISYMPAVFGCALASVVLRGLLNEPITSKKRG